jgi:Notch-like protein
LFFSSFWIYKDACAKASCNYGTCINEVTSYRCECHRGYEGAACDRQIDPCANFVCYNEGVCIVQQDYQPMCQCAHGYRGPNCYESDGMCGQDDQARLVCICECCVILSDEIREMKKDKTKCMLS